MTKISVAIVTWNRKPYVLRAIESIYSQPYRPVEVVVADSASTDGTVEAIAEKFPDVKIIRLHENLGCPGGRNIAMANCTGDIIVSLDDDAWFLSDNILAECAERFEANADLGVTGFNIVSPNSVKGTGDDYETARFIGCAMAISKKALDSVGYFPQEFFRQAEESDLALRLLDAGYRIIGCPSLNIYHEKAPVNRNAKKFLFYNTRNNLSIIYRRFPLFLVPVAVVYKTLAYNFEGIKKGALRYTLAGTLAGFYRMPFYLTRREPVSFKTVKKFQKNKYLFFPRITGV